MSAYEWHFVTEKLATALLTGLGLFLLLRYPVVEDFNRKYGWFVPTSDLGCLLYEVSCRACGLIFFLAGLLHLVGFI
jgi:hypothetical protein